MTSSVIYSSFTGNTKKIAELIARQMGAELMRVKEVPLNWEPTDLIVIGTGVYANRPAQPLIRWLYSSPSFKGKKAAVFVTAGDMEQARQNARWLIKVLESKGATVHKTAFVCKGAFLWVFGAGHPNIKEKQAAIEFAMTLAPKKQSARRRKAPRKPAGKKSKKKPARKKPKPKPKKQPARKKKVSKKPKRGTTKKKGKK